MAEKVTQEMRDEEPYRWCVYCDADCDVDEPEHTAECPSSTRVYHVRYEADSPPCEKCGHRRSPAIRCSECGCVLELGDPYTHRRDGETTGLAGMDFAESVP